MILLNLFFTFFKIGAFTFGGGYAMLPLIQQAVLDKGWLTAEEIVNFIAISESTPGPFAINIATYVGMETASVLGAICATLGVVVPSFVIILIIAHFFERFKDNKWVSAVMLGLKATVVALIFSAVLSVGKTVFLPEGFTFETFKTGEFWVSLAIFASTAVLAFKKKHPILIVTISATVGILAGYILNF